VLDAATGRLRWSLPVPVTPLPGGRVGVVQRQEFRSGTVYDQDSGEPGLLYFSSTGEPHTEPPLRTEIRGVDLSTGATLWSTSLAGSVNVFEVPGTAPAVLILSSARIERRDGVTGAVARLATPADFGGARPVGGNLVGGTLIVFYGASGEREVAYDPETLRRLWDRSVPEVLLDPPSCSDVLCAGGRAALDVLDPVTGRPLWRAPADVDLSRRAGYVAEVDSRSGMLRRLVDPMTGSTRVDLTTWWSEPIGPADQRPVLRRLDHSRDTVFGVVDSRRDAVQPLGVISGVVSDCTADRGYVVCRGDGGLRIWAYRA
jgi:outer membrane protein assembly factor BamB